MQPLWDQDDGLDGALAYKLAAEGKLANTGWFCVTWQTRQELFRSSAATWLSR